MRVGLIGAGNMASALARGWGDPVLCADPVGERAQRLAEELGGSALASNAEVAERAEIVVLCHKPAQLEEVAAEIAAGEIAATEIAATEIAATETAAAGIEARPRAVVSILAATPLSRLKQAYPDTCVYRVLPSTPVEVRQGAIVKAADEPQDESVDAAVNELFARLGTVVTVEDRLVDVAMGLMSCAPAYMALVAEAQIDAGVRRGLRAEQAAQLVVQTMAGTAELLARRDYDTLAVRRAVTSPGGLTAKGLAALERGGLRSAFDGALDAVLREGESR